MDGLPQNKAAATPTLALASTWVVGNRGALTVFCLMILSIMTYCMMNVRRKIDVGARPYVRENGTVAKAYNAWTTEKILENMWGEHIHLGYYSAGERIRSL